MGDNIGVSVNEWDQLIDEYAKLEDCYIKLEHKHDNLRKRLVGLQKYIHNYADPHNGEFIHKSSAVDLVERILDGRALLD